MNNFEIKQFVLSEFEKGKTVVIIDTENEFKQLCKALNGAYITNRNELKGVENNLVVINKGLISA